jgi:selenophosphate synthase
MAIESQCNFMQFTEPCGCEVELSAADFLQFLLSLPASRDPRLLAGPVTFDDAAVWRLPNDSFLVQTTVNKGRG